MRTGSAHNVHVFPQSVNSIQHNPDRFPAVSGAPGNVSEGFTSRSTWHMYKTVKEAMLSSVGLLLCLVFLSVSNTTKKSYKRIQ